MKLLNFQILKSFFLLPLTCLLINCLSFTISQAKEASKKTVYKNSDDDLLRLNSVFIEPFSDNANGIYSAKGFELIKTLVEENKQWNLVDNKSNADLVISSRLTKNPESVTLKMSLVINKKNGFEFSDSINLGSVFETEKVLLSYQKLFSSLKKRIPYQALILSRKNDIITINLGSRNGLADSSELLAIIITKINLHPKNNTFISSEKEILGKVIITKADEYLSFGKIIYERVDGAIQKNTKLEYTNFNLNQSAQAGLGLQKDAPVVLGKTQAQEWIPRSAPQYGKISLSGGAIQYTQSVGFKNISSNNFSQWLSPTLRASGELWLLPEFFLELSFRETLLKGSNPLEGSSPSSVDMNLSQYSLKGLFNYELDQNPQSPSFQFALGISNFKAIPSSTTPVAVSDMSYGGLLLGFKGTFGVSEELPIYLSIYFNYFLTKTLDDSKSGSPSGVQMNDFGLSLRFAKTQNYSYIFNLGFESYSSDFNSSTGTRSEPVSNISHKLVSTLAGIEYSF